MLTLLPIVKENGKASSGINSEFYNVVLSPIFVFLPILTGLSNALMTLPNPTYVSCAINTHPKTVALGAIYADLDIAIGLP
jgi:hypothetical protein